MIGAYIIAVILLGLAANLIAYDYLNTYYGGLKKRTAVIIVLGAVPFALLTLVLGIIVQRKKGGSGQ